ncbi:MFS general substrate transporter [Xylariaceae sp. FL0016]|nr:MFS general substrate transporter [Xylariaceae sp. FL0016]
MEPIDPRPGPSSPSGTRHDGQNADGRADTDLNSTGRVSVITPVGDVAGSKRGALHTAGVDHSAVIDDKAPIVRLYLTFSTRLPTPNTAIAAAAATSLSGSPLPECPDLSQYTNPFTWPRARKNIMVALSCIATCLTAYTAGAYSQPANLIAAELDTTRIGALAGVTTYCMGFALAPMVLAPFSEINGRYPVFAIAGLIFTAMQGVCGAVTNLAGMLVARFVKGVGGSVFSTMVGGVIADLYEKEDRNTPMALFSGAVLVGTGLGPLVAGYMVQNWGDQGEKWKWIFWHQVIMDFVLMVFVIVFFKESRASVLLSRKARSLNTWYQELEALGIFGVWLQPDVVQVDNSVDPKIPLSHPASIDHKEAEGEKRRSTSLWESPAASTISGLKLQRIRWIVKEDEQRDSISQMVRTSLFRPFHLLFTEPIVFFFSLWVSFAWAVLYLTFGSIPLVFQRQYGFDSEESGYVFAAMIIGAVLATVIGVYQEGILKHPKWQDKSEMTGTDGTEDSESRLDRGRCWDFLQRRFPVDSPEARLYLTCLTSILLPTGLYLFGFSAQPSTHWSVPAIAIGLATMGIYYVYLATFNYFADIYQTWASSALAAQSFCRNVLAGVIPLCTGALIQNLGEDTAGGMLGGMATALTVVPWVLVLYGETIRRRSAFAIVLENR